MRNFEKKGKRFLKLYPKYLHNFENNETIILNMRQKFSSLSNGEL